MGAQVIPDIAPGDDEIVLPKTASRVFSSTILERVLRNMGIEEVVVAGVLTISVLKWLYEIGSTEAST